MLNLIICSFSPHSSARGRSSHIAQLWHSHFHSACNQSHIDILHNTPTGRGYRIKYHRTRGTHWRIYCSESFPGMRALWEGEKERVHVLYQSPGSLTSVWQVHCRELASVLSTIEARVQTCMIYMAHHKRLMKQHMYVRIRIYDTHSTSHPSMVWLQLPPLDMQKCTPSNYCKTSLCSH